MKTKPTADSAEALLDRLALAREDALIAAAAVDAADATYRAGLLTESPTAVRRLIDAKTEAAISADRATAVFADLELRIAAAGVSAAEAARDARYNAAAKLAAIATAELAKYPAAAEMIRSVLRAVAEADIAIAAANGDLPAGKAPIVHPESFRSLPNLPEEVISEEVVALWAHVTDSTPLPDHRQGEVSARGFIRVGRNEFECVKRTYRRQTVLPAVYGRHVAPLASEIKLPGAFGESPFWEPTHHQADVLRQLDKHRRPPAVDSPREPMVTVITMSRE